MQPEHDGIVRSDSQHAVGLFSDEPVVLGAARALVEAATGLSLVVAESELSRVVHMVCERQPEVLLLDHSSDSHLSIVRDLRQTAPGCKLILWTRSVGMDVAWQAVELGIRGILLKTLAPELLVKCLRTVATGELWLDNTLTSRMLSSTAVRLTPREGQLVMLLAQGLKNKEIATELNLTEGTVKVYMSKLFEKVGAKDRFELALFGARNIGSLVRPATGAPGRGFTMRSMLARTVSRPHDKAPVSDRRLTATGTFN